METKLCCIKDSTIKGAGKGVFAKKLIPKGTKICSYRGKIVDEEVYHNLSENEKDKCYFVNKNHIIVGENIGAYINDIVDFREYDEKTLVDIIYNGYMPVHPDKEHNCHYWIIPNEKLRVYIYSLKDIQPEEELFAKYGNHYWERKFDETYYHYQTRMVQLQVPDYKNNISKPEPPMEEYKKLELVKSP